MSRARIRNHVPWIVVVAVVCATVVIGSWPDPDVRNGVSEDGVVSVRTPASEQQYLVIEQEPTSETHTVLVPPIYHITLADQALPSRAEISMNTSQADVIFGYDASVMAWRALLPEGTPAELTVYAYPLITRYAAGNRKAYSPPTDQWERIDALMATAPPHAVGALVSTAYAWSPDEWILQEEGMTGGCDGVFVRTQQTSISSVEIEQPNKETFRITAQWFLNNEGCKPGFVMHTTTNVIY